MTGADAPVVRQARPEDLPRLLDLLQQLSENGARPEQDVRDVTERHAESLRALTDAPHCTVLVAAVDAEVLGCCTLYVLPNLSHGAAPWGVVENVVVDERARGKGLGAMLMAEAVRLAKEVGCYKLALMSNARRVDAHRFYERIGFESSHTGFTAYFI